MPHSLTEDLDALVLLAEEGHDVRELLTPAGQAWLDKEVQSALLIEAICGEGAALTDRDAAADWAEQVLAVLGRRGPMNIPETAVLLGMSRQAVQQRTRIALGNMPNHLVRRAKVYADAMDDERGVDR